MVNSWRVQQAAREIRAGAVIAYPTEAVWGLGCDPWDEEAVERLLALLDEEGKGGEIARETFTRLGKDRCAAPLMRKPTRRCVDCTARR